MAIDEHGGAEIGQALAPHLGRRRVDSITSVPSPSRSSFFVDEIDVRLDDGTTLELMAKAVHWDAMVPEGRSAKPRFLWSEERERASYAAILSTLGLGTARYFGSYVDSSGARYLLLERVHGVPLWQRGDLDAWREAARWLARLHVRVGARRATHSAAGPYLLHYDRGYYQRWIARARAFHRHRRHELQALTERYARLLEWWLAEPTTFIHGEFYASNVLIEARDDARSGCVARPVDWEMAAIGPAAVDLACLVAGHWTDEERAAIADAYWRESALEDGHPCARDRSLQTLDYCLVHLCVRNLGWARDWTPPPDQVHDWLTEALRLCDKWQR